MHFSSSVNHGILLGSGPRRYLHHLTVKTFSEETLLIHFKFLFTRMASRRPSFGFSGRRPRRTIHYSQMNSQLRQHSTPIPCAGAEYMSSLKRKGYWFIVPRKLQCYLYFKSVIFKKTFYKNLQKKQSLLHPWAVWL